MLPNLKYMKNTLVLKSFLTAAVAGGIALSAHAELIFSDDFSYGSVSEFTDAWTVSGSPTLATGQAGFDGGDAVSIARTTTSDFLSRSFSNEPTDAEPLQFTVRMFDSGSGTLRINTAGIRTGATPLFEMGFNNGNFNQYGVRIVNFHGNEGWLYFGGASTSGDNIRVEGWHTFQATIGATSSTYALDLGSNGTIDHTLNSSGTMPGPFTELRIGGPGFAAAENIATSYDSLTLETIPEPSTYAAIFGGLALLGAFVYRRRLSAKK